MQQYEDVDNYHCGHCKYFKVNADRDESTCKRIDHKAVKFAVSWFKSYDCHQRTGVICSDFEPAKWCIHACKVWTGFEDYWKAYVEQWLPYGNTNTTRSFTLHGDSSVRYKVSLMDFVNGTMIENGTLKAVEKTYYKQDRNPNGFGYKLVHEAIEGVKI